MNNQRPEPNRPFSFHLLVTLLESRKEVRKTLEELRSSYNNLYRDVQIKLVENGPAGSTAIVGSHGPLHDPWESLEVVSGRFSPLDRVVDRWIAEAEKRKTAFVTSHFSRTPYKSRTMTAEVVMKYDPMAQSKGMIKTDVSVDGMDIMNFQCSIVNAIQYRPMYEKIWGPLPPLPQEPERPETVTILKSDLDDLVATAARAPALIPIHERFRPDFFA